MQPINYCRLWIEPQGLFRETQRIQLQIVPHQEPRTDEALQAQTENTIELLRQLVLAATRMGYAVHYSDSTRALMAEKEGAK